MLKEYSGLLSLHSYGEADGILFLSSIGGPLAEELEWMHRKNVTVRYWVTDKQSTKEEAKEAFIHTLCGKADVNFGAKYSEITGYLWTDEELNVGGHSLINRLKSEVGKWVHLEIEVAQ
jgi:hypothetical protein